MRPTLRLRLTLLYGAVTVVVGALLLALAYALVSRAFDQGPQAPPNAFLLVTDADGATYRINARAFQDLLSSRALDDLLQKGLLGLLLLGGLGAAAGWFVGGRALAPLHRVTATARRVATENLDERIALAGPDDEVKELADTFDQMLGRLDAAFDSQRRFVANASHELRTPLAVMRTEVDVALADPDATVADLRRMGAVVRRATERADRLVDALLLLARSEAMARDGVAVREPLDLQEVASTALRTVREEAAGRELRMETACTPAPVRGDPELLERLAGNLVENAVRHNVDGGWVQVGTRAAAGWAQLRVASSGPPVADDEVDALFEPFRRGGTARTATRGAGVGLSIVRAVASAHGGSVAGRPVPGGGLEVVVSLPARE